MMLNTEFANLKLKYISCDFRITAVANKSSDRLFSEKGFNEILSKMFIGKSRECNNQKLQPTPDTKRKRKKTKIYACKMNKQMHEKHIPAPSSPSEVITMLKRLKKHKDIEQGKAKHEVLVV